MRAKGMVRRLALIPLLASLQAPAALAGGYSVGVTGGLSAPMGDFKDRVKIGYNAGGMADYGGTSMFGAGIEVGYHSWKGKSAYWEALAVDDGAAPGTIVNAELSALQYGVHGTVTPPIAGPIHPYGQVGIEGYNLKLTTTSDDPDYAVDFSKNLFGYNVGVGVTYTLVPTTSLGILGLYHHANAKEDFGASATWIGVNAVLTFHIPPAK